MMRRTLLVTAALLALTAAGATAVIDRSLAAMLELADVIVYGQVAEVVAETVATVDGEEIRTRVTFDVARDLASPDEPLEELVLSFLGGRTAAGAATEVAGVPTFTVGEHVLLLAYDDPAADGAADGDGPSARLASPVVGVWQGMWRLGPSGLGDERGRLLTPGPDGLAVDGPGGDITAVLDAIAAWLGGESEIAPEAAAAADAAPVAPEVGDAAAGVDPGAASEAGGGAAGMPGADDAADEADAELDAEVDADGVAAGGGDAAPAAGADGAAQDAAAGAGGAPDAAAEAAGEGPPGADAPDDALAIVLRPPESDALQRTVEAAAAAWRAAGADVVVTFDDAAADTVRLGDPATLGPDALALRVRPAGGDGSDLLLHPDAVTRTDVVAFELAALAGTARTDAGLLSGRFDATRPTPPTAADAAALRADRERLPGDLDGDGDVDFYDLARVAEAYGRTGGRLAADLDGSGRVDDADLDLLRERYEFRPPAPEPPPGWTANPD